MPEAAAKCLDKGYVSILSIDANDLYVVNGARASFAAHSQAMGKREEGLINFLMREKHSSPFEQGSFRFEVKAPIFVVREWQRHRIGSFNEFSGRYAQFEPEFYLPLGRVRKQEGTPGEYTFSRVMPAQDDLVCSRMEQACNNAFLLYRELLEEGIAKEVARMVLPLNMYTTFVWQQNPRSLMNFLRLRNDENAQEEIREYASVIEAIFNREMPVTAAAFNAHGRTC